MVRGSADRFFCRDAPFSWRRLLRVLLSKVSRPNVENVVYPPRTPISSATRYSSRISTRPANAAERNLISRQPLTLTISVPSGKRPSASRCPQPPSAYRSTPPRPDPTKMSTSLHIATPTTRAPRECGIASRAEPRPSGRAEPLRDANVAARIRCGFNQALHYRARVIRPGASSGRTPAPPLFFVA